MVCGREGGREGHREREAGINWFFFRWSSEGRLLAVVIFEPKSKRVETMPCKGLGEE